MEFQSRHIRGAGRGKDLGFPTINLEIPDSFTLETGVYAAWVNIDERRYPAALHYGPIPSFGDNKLNLEVYLLDIEQKLPLGLISEVITVSTVQRLRDIKHFDTVQALQTQIDTDVEQVRMILKK